MSDQMGSVTHESGDDFFVLDSVQDVLTEIKEKSSLGSDQLTTVICSAVHVGSERGQAKLINLFQR